MDGFSGGVTSASWRRSDWIFITRCLGSLHCCCLVVQFCSWRLVGKKRGCARAGGDVEEREKYVMVVNGYCGWLRLFLNWIYFSLARILIVLRMEYGYRGLFYMVGMVCIMLAVEATLLILMVVLLGTIQWGWCWDFFKLRSESAIGVTAGSEWLDDGIFTVHCFMLGVMISKLIQVWVKIMYRG